MFKKLILFFIVCCAPILTYAQIPAIELACPAGTTPLSPVSPTFDVVTGGIKQWLCVDIFGNVQSAISANLTTPSQGYFFGGIVVAPVTITPVTGVINSVTNQAKAIQFVLPFAINVNRVTWEVQAGAGDNVSFGIYAADGLTRLLTTGVVTSVGAAAAQQTILPSTVYLPAGVYWFAWCQQGTTTTFGATTNAAVNSLILNAGGGTRVRQVTVSGGTACTNGAIPPTITGLNASQQIIPLVMFEP